MVVRGQQEQWKGCHQGERGDLSPPQDIDPRGPQSRQSDGQERHHKFSGQCRRGEPPRHAARRGHAEESGDHQNAVGRRVQDLANVGDLMPASRDESINPVRRSQDRE
jgi:hypothetical protein